MKINIFKFEKMNNKKNKNVKTNDEFLKDF